MSDHSESRCLALFFDLLVLSAVLVATSAQAADEPKIPHWYEVITGIIAIPAALIGLAYSYLLIKKTRLESRKTELEILEKERQLSQVAPTVSRATLSDFISAPAGGNRLILLLLLRFVILYLVLTAWGVITDLFEVLFTGAIVSAQQILKWTLSGRATIPIVIVQSLPKIGYWLIFFSLAWPLFKDINSALGIDVKNFLKVSTVLEELRRKSQK